MECNQITLYELIKMLENDKLFFSGTLKMSNNDSLDYGELLGCRENRRYLLYAEDVIKIFDEFYNNISSQTFIFAHRDLVSNEGYLKYDDKNVSSYILVLGNFILYQFYQIYKKGYIELFSGKHMYLYYNPLLSEFVYTYDHRKPLLYLNIIDILSNSTEDSTEKIEEEIHSLNRIITYDVKEIYNNIQKLRNIYEHRVNVYCLDKYASYDDYIKLLDDFDKKSISSHEDNLLYLMNYKLLTNYRDCLNEFRSECVKNNTPEASVRGLLLALIIYSFHLNDIKYLYSVFTNRNFGRKLHSRISDTMPDEHGYNLANECRSKIRAGFVFSQKRWNNYIKIIQDIDITDEEAIYANYGIYLILTGSNIRKDNSEISYVLKKHIEKVLKTDRYNNKMNLQDDLDKLYKVFLNNLENRMGYKQIENTVKYYNELIETMNEITDY